MAPHQTCRGCGRTAAAIAWELAARVGFTHPEYDRTYAFTLHTDKQGRFAFCAACERRERGMDLFQLPTPKKKESDEKKTPID